MNKKMIVLIIAFILLLAGCNKINSLDHADTTYPHDNEVFSTIEEYIYSKLPNPEDVSLMADVDAYFKLPPNPQYRRVYYSGVDNLPDLYDIQEYNAWVDNTPFVENEMRVLQYIRDHNISKEDFITAVSNSLKRYERLGYDVTEEMFELPNPDIIYTFDNEIINKYYARNK